MSQQGNALGRIIQAAYERERAIEVRHTRSTDVPELVRIDAATSRDLRPWTEADFRAFSHDHPSEFLTALLRGRVVGFLVAERDPMRLEVRKVAAEADFQRVGAALVSRMIASECCGRSVACAKVRESDAKVQEFFQGLGFRPLCTVEDHFTDPAEDAVLMQFNFAGTKGGAT